MTPLTTNCLLLPRNANQGSWLAATSQTCFFAVLDLFSYGIFTGPDISTLIVTFRQHGGIIRPTQGATISRGLYAGGIQLWML